MNRIEIDDDGQTIRVYLSRWPPILKAICFVLVGFAIAAGLLLAMFVVAEAANRGSEETLNRLFGFTIFYIPTYFVVGLGLLIFGVARLMRKTPRIEISESGITIFRRERRKIIWQNVSAIQVRRFWRNITVSEVCTKTDGSSKNSKVSSLPYELELGTLKYLQYRISRYCPGKISPPAGYDPWDDEIKYLSPTQVARLARQSFGADALAFVEKRRAMAARRLLGSRHAAAWEEVVEMLAKDG